MPTPPRGGRFAMIGAGALAAMLVFAGCSRASGGDTSASATNSGPASELRLGYFPNVTHAAALIGVDKGYFTKELGNTKLTPATFNAGPDEIGALLGGSLDAAFVGSGPAITAFAKSDGKDVRIIAGATSGGAQLVVKPDIHSPADLKGKTIATPQLGNTQDVALKKYLSNQHLTGQVNVQNNDNSQMLSEFQKNQIQGAWLPEPYASKLVLEGGAKVLVDEKTLWPQGKFPTTVLLVRTQFLNQHPATVQALLTGELDAINYAATDKSGAETAINDQLQKLTQKKLSQKELDRAYGDIELTVDPLASRFPQLAKDQVTAGTAKSAASVNGLFDLSALNTVLGKAGKPTADAAGLAAK